MTKGDNGVMVKILNVVLVTFILRTMPSGLAIHSPIASVLSVRCSAQYYFHVNGLSGNMYCVLLWSHVEPMFCSDVTS